MQARYQSPTIGRFVSEDPAFLAIGDPLFKQQYGQSLSQFLANPQQINSYSYVNNNPLGYKDPTGKLFGLDDAFVIGVVLPLLEYGGLFITSIDATTAVFVTANQLPVEDNVEVWGQVGLDVTGMRMGSTLAPANRVIFDALSLPVGTGVQYLQDNLRPTKKATPLIGSPVMCPVSQSGQGTITVGASTQSIGGGRPTSSTVTSASGGSSNRSSSSGSRNSSASSPSSSSSSVNWAAVRTAVLAYYASGGK